MTTLLSKIRQRGYWQFTIRPISFLSNRIADISNLFPLILKSVVSSRGWNFPQIDNRYEPLIGNDWIGQELDSDMHKEIWRFYQSGQFIYIRGLPVDWRDESTWWKAEAGWEPMTLLGVGDTIFTFIEAHEFASRLAFTDTVDEKLHLEIKIMNLEKRELYIDSRGHRWPFDYPHRTAMHEYPYIYDGLRADLISNFKSQGLLAAQHFFKRFGWEASIEILGGWYEERR